MMSIPKGSFCYTGLMSVTVPASVTSIGNGAFGFCKNLTDITILNPDCEILDDADTDSRYGESCTISNSSDKDDADNFLFTGTIHGYAGSTAEAYAKKYNRRFEAIAQDDNLKEMLPGKWVLYKEYRDGKLYADQGIVLGQDLLLGESWFKLEPDGTGTFLELIRKDGRLERHISPLKWTLNGNAVLLELSYLDNDTPFIAEFNLRDGDLAYQLDRYGNGSDISDQYYHKLTAAEEAAEQELPGKWSFYKMYLNDKLIADNGVMISDGTPVEESWFKLEADGTGKFLEYLIKPNDETEMVESPLTWIMTGSAAALDLEYQASAAASQHKVFLFTLTDGDLVVLLDRTGDGSQISEMYYRKDAQQPVSVGDYNGDGTVSIADAVLLARYVAEDKTLTAEQLAGIFAAEPDFDGDGLVTVADIAAILANAKEDIA